LAPENGSHLTASSAGKSELQRNLAQKRFFFSSLPGLGEINKREKDVLTLHAADLLPVEMPWKGTPNSPLMLFETPYRQLIPFFDHYNKGDGLNDPWLDKDMQPLALTEPEIDDVIAFSRNSHQLAVRKAGRPRVKTPACCGPCQPDTTRYRPGLRPETSPAKTVAELWGDTAVRSVPIGVEL
jgi:hypothetical protein